jgi:hypothetical protein
MHGKRKNIHRLPLAAIALCILFSGTLHSQVKRIHTYGDYNQNFMISPNAPEYGVLGTPYLNPEFMFGNVRIKDGSEMQTLLRYNIYNQTLEVILEKDTLELVRAFSLEDFTLNNRKFVYRLYTAEEFGKTFLAADYFEVLAESGKLELLRQHKMVVETNIAISNYMGGIGDGRDYFVHRTDLYLMDHRDKSIRKLDTGKRDFLSLFGEKKDEIRSYIREENLKLSKEEDLIRIINYYNSLVS